MYTKSNGPLAESIGNDTIHFDSLCEYCSTDRPIDQTNTEPKSIHSYLCSID